MKKILMALALLVSYGAVAQVSVHGYTKKDGTYVQPHQRTAPDSTINNNYSTKGNVNPYNGKAGTVEPTSTPTPSTWAQPSAPTPAPKTSGYGTKPACNSSYQTC
ncbi:hypothetical protein [Duganella sp. Leaf61]|uniref:hypothetical protein n=1 Tax=Duganella sp. Leaf61 TaxID=1736227 RepID=UPI000A7C242B|nr:hypothetical protein [Duganella sp. Leaf61]